MDQELTNSCRPFPVGGDENMSSTELVMVDKLRYTVGKDRQITCIIMFVVR